MRPRPALRQKFGVAFCLAAAACSPSPPVQSGAAASPAADRQAVESVVRSHWAAINAGDTVTISAQHAAELSIFITELPDRFMIPSPTADSLYPALVANKPNYTVEDLRVQVVGDVGIASLYLGGGVVLADGSRDARRRQVTEVWVRQPDGAWKEVHHHDSVFANR